MCWSDDGKTIWGVLTWIAASHYNFFSYDCVKNKLNTYNVPYGCKYDYEINPNQGTLLYSNYLFIVDADEADNLIKTETIICLYILDFYTNQQKLITTSKGKQFNPRWLTNELIEYDSPIENKREKMKYKK